MLYLDAADGATIVVRTDGLTRAKVGDRVTVGFDPRSCHLFDSAGRAVVNGSLI